MDTAIARPELLLVADAVAREKNIDREEVLEAMEQAIQKAGRAKYGHEKDIRATIDRKTGDVRLSRWTEIVDAVENEETQIPVTIALNSLNRSMGLVDPYPFVLCSEVIEKLRFVHDVVSLWNASERRQSRCIARWLKQREKRAAPAASVEAQPASAPA